MVNTGFMTVAPLLLLLPALASCSISITLHSKNETHPIFSLSGYDSHVIGNKEEIIFNINDNLLKAAVKSLSGSVPESVYLHSPTPNYDIYKSKGWSEVKCTVRPTAYDILSIKTLDVIDHTILDWSEKTSKIVPVKETIRTKWNLPHVFNATEPIFYSIEPIPSFSLTSKFGFNIDKPVDALIMYEKHPNLILIKDQVARAVLNVKKIILKVEIEYTATLSGVVACHYPNLHQGSTYWDYDINEVLKAAGNPRKVISTEEVTFEYHTNGKVKVTDHSTNAVLLEYDALISMNHIF